MFFYKNQVKDCSPAAPASAPESVGHLQGDSVLEFSVEAAVLVLEQGVE